MEHSYLLLYKQIIIKILSTLCTKIICPKKYVVSMKCPSWDK